jgi:hypothetical protein
MTGKLLKLKSWVTLKDAASHLSLLLEETVNESDLIQLALEQKLTLSVVFPEPVSVVLYEQCDVSGEGSAEDVVEHSPQELKELLALLKKDRRRDWRYFEGGQVYEPSFDYGYTLSGLNNLIMSETISWVLAEFLQSSLSKPPLSSLFRCGGPIMIFEPESELLWGLVNFIPNDSGPEDASLAERAEWVNEIPKSASLVLSNDTLARFTASLLNDDEVEPPATSANDSEIKRLQRTVAALALGLAAKPGTYNKAGKPNVSQLAKLATEHLRDGQSDRTPPGFSDTTVRNTITAALNACPELKG